MKLWGGRFTSTADSATDHFHSSISFDRRLYREDIAGSVAHAAMLGRQGIIPQSDADDICEALEKIAEDIEKGEIVFDEQAEDIHMNIEKILTERIGQKGKRLHTGRSRNDQVALDMRMYVKKEIQKIRAELKSLISTFTSLAAEHIDTIMPGYTHMQRAQPVTLAHHLLAYAEMFKRDAARLSDAFVRMDCMPLGAGALAATTYPLDRGAVCDALGFESITLNSLDAVSDRDFCIELLCALSIVMMHASRLCEELVLWSSHEFQFIEMDDRYATGSSIMPQKKNPDMAELIRGKTGRVYGDLVGLLTVMKGLPLAYNKDMQEDKESVFDAIDTVEMCLPVLNGMLATMTVNARNMYRAAGGGFTNATDAADWLVGKGVPFRDAHEIIGKLVLYCLSVSKSLDELSIDEYRAISDVFDDGIYDAIALERCVNARTVPGGPARENVEKLFRLNEEYLKEN